MFQDKVMADNGCYLWQNCFNCPYPDCLVDRIPSLLRANKQADIRDLDKQGMTAAEIAEKFGIPQRTVYRYLAKIS